MKAILKVSEPLLISYGQTIFLQVLALVLIAAGLALVLLGCCSDGAPTLQSGKRRSTVLRQ